MDSIIIIPCRFGSTRLPQKFKAQILDKPLIEHVFNCAAKTGVDSYVALDHQEIESLVANFGGKFIRTSDKHQSGSDRVAEAVSLIDPENKYQFVVCLQGDIPFISKESILSGLDFAKKNNFDIATYGYISNDYNLSEKTSNVKIVTDRNDKALYFSRSMIPFNAKEFIHHVGIYIYRRESLKKFVSMPHGRLETSESLEQLRALENNMTIGVKIIDENPVSVDVPEDIELAENYGIKFRNREGL